MTSPEEAAREYKLTLDELVNNNKTQINLLTILAEDYQQYAPAIVDTIDKQIYRVPKDQKLPVMYVTDSILKNVSNDQYKELFAKVIIRVFLHVFKEGDEKVRSALYKLRQTWTEVFNRSKLYQLDMKVNEEDRAWPISNPVKPVQATPTSTSASRPQPAKVHINPKFIQNGSKAPRDPRTRTVTVDDKNVRVQIVKKESPKTAEPKKELIDELLSLPPPITHVKSEPDEPTPPARISPNPPKRKADTPPLDIQNKKRRSPRLKDQDHRIHHPPAPGSMNTVVQPTATLGSHAFVSNPVVAPAVAPVAHHVPSALSSYAGGVPSMYPSSAPSPLIPMSTPLPMPSFPPQPQTGFPVSNNGPSAFAYSGQHHAPTPSQPPVITHETVRLEGIPANNRIFVDGKAHEVEYLDNVAVIERNGLPHRIYFAGTPRNVIIDGVAHLLNFGDSKTVFIDGEPHVLRFGAPSRELYMGNFPFKGQFGGAPIIATINGRRHEIRLGGPAPDVKIDPDPAYELAPEMNRKRASKLTPEPKVAPQVDAFSLLKKLQQSGYLKVNKPVEKNERPKKPFREMTPPIPSEHSLNVVERRPAPSSSLKEFNMRLLKIRYDSVVDALHEKQQNACPHCGMRMELRGEKYERHLDWHVKRNLKTFERSSTSRPWYASSKDWLKSEEDEEAGTSGSHGATDTADETSGTTPAVVSHETVNKKFPCAGQLWNNGFFQQHLGSCCFENSRSDSLLCNNCFVCGEKFEEYFDEEDDVWKLRDCVMVNKKTFHSACVQDASVLDDSTADVSCDPDLFVHESKLLNTLQTGQ